MEYLAQLGVAVAEFFEAEGRSLRRNLIKLAAAAGFGLVLLLLALAGVGFVIAGIFMLLAQMMSPGDAAVVMGVTALACAGIGILCIRSMFT
jgi:hypothetical protein